MGNGPETLANINNLRPYVKAGNVIHIGQRDMKEAELSGSSRLQDTDATCIDYDYFTANGIEATIASLLGRLQQMATKRYWIHFDTDVIADDENPAVDYRLAGGLRFDDCELLLTALIKSLNIAGITITIFNPSKDIDGAIGQRLVRMLGKCVNL